MVCKPAGIPRLHALCLLALASLVAAPAQAQSDATTAEEALENARSLYGPPPPRRSCAPQEANSENEITVCAQQAQDDAEFRVQSSSELKETKPGDIIPGAPDVSGDGIFKGPASIGGMCLLGGCPAEEAYMIDFDLLPDTPEGSDADLIAQGKKSAD